jgi:Rad3-related DNA helicase
MEKIMSSQELPNFDIVTSPKEKKGIMDFWPMPQYKPRKSQIQTLKWIEQLPENVRYILCEIPVGGGKSPLALTLSGWLSQSLGNSFVLTPQKILQKQYEDSFDEKYIGTIYGKVNYTCEGKKTNCDIGSDLKPPCAECPAKSALNLALASPNMVMNYKLALLYFSFMDTKKMPPRKLMVFDECHTLEHHLVEFSTLTISEFRCKKFGIKFFQPKSLKEAYGFLETTYHAAASKKVNEIHKQVQELENEISMDPRGLSPAEVNMVREFKELSDHIMEIENIMSQGVPVLEDEYVLISEKTFFKFKEIYGKKIFHGMVKPRADKFLFMSSTILNKEAFCRDLGINPNEAAFISLHSEFEIENRPVIYIPEMKMSYGWNKDDKRESRKDMLLRIKEICESHADQSGIIHTASFQVADWLVKELEGVVPHQIIHHLPESGLDRGQVIDEFMANKGEIPTLLISPSITEGLDLKGDIGRFAIFVKVPYPYLGDAWIKRRMELSKEWYNRQAMIGVIQGGGRVVRNEEDWGYTYILDGAFDGLYAQMKYNIPEWWKEGLQRV